MGKTSLFWRIRYWIAYYVLPPNFYLFIGSEPKFCDLANDRGCSLEMMDRDAEYQRAIWALIMAAGGEIKIPRVILHDAGLMGAVETRTDIDGSYTYTAKS